MPASMADAVTWDVGPLTKNYIRDNWGSLADSAGPAAPSVFRLFSEDESGNPKKGWDPAGQEYILVKEVDGSRTISWEDGSRDVANLSNVATIRATTPTSRARRTALHDELVTLYENVRKRSSTALGGWDTISLEPTNVPDEQFNFWMVEMTWLFEKKGVVLS